MKIVYQGLLLGLASLLSAGALYANCPHVKGHYVSWHNDNDLYCTYESDRSFERGGQDTKSCTAAFTLSNDDYQLIRCKFSRKKRKCMCVISKQ
jgi:hypothetical protein